MRVTGPLEEFAPHDPPPTVRGAGATSPRKVVLLALWFALGAGFVEAAVLAAKKLAFGEILWLSPHFPWMAPVANAALFAVPAALLAAAATAWPRRLPLQVPVAVLALPAWVGLLFLIPRLHRAALLLLALGMTVQTVRLATAHPGGFRRLVRRSTPWMALAVGGLVVGLLGWPPLRERRALAALPTAEPGAPNLLLIVLDTVRAQSLGLYGYERPTSPQLERWAAGGVVFERALSTSPWTLPSHGSLFTGRYPHELSADWLVPLDSAEPTLAEVLRARGYRTGGFVANTYYTSAEFGLDRGFLRYEDYRLSLGELANSSALARLIFSGHYRVHGRSWVLDNHQFLGRKSAGMLRHDVRSWLEDDRQRPFFAFVNYYDAHDPYVPPPPFDARFGVRRTEGGLLRRFWMSAKAWVDGGGDADPSLPPAEVLRSDRDSYDASIAALDHELGLLLGELERDDVLRNTLVVITSDHGELFGEHGLTRHGNSLYWPLLHVPLVIVFPQRVPAGPRVAEPVTLRDLPATVLELLGGGKHPLPGSSLAPLWALPSSGAATASPLLSEVRQGIHKPDREPVSRGDMQSLVMDGSHYIRNGDGREELYRLAHGPGELRDLAGSWGSVPQLAAFRGVLETLLARPVTPPGPSASTGR
ncbi:MAG: sulfatase [Gemmatimonadota bacterium]